VRWEPPTDSHGVEVRREEVEIRGAAANGKVTKIKTAGEGSVQNFRGLPPKNGVRNCCGLHLADSP